MGIISEVWHGFLQGIGVELSFFVLWLGYKFTPWRERVHPGHWLHKIAEYFE